VSVVTYLEAIRQALWEEMESDPSVFLLGQDVGTYGGPFRVTAGMLDRFGPERVIDTPISESAMVGAAIGAAMLGMRPVVEMQFIDFISCAFNQIVNFAGPNHYRWGQQVPLVIRGPAGGNVHGSAFHSQNPESYFQHTPGLKIVAPATVADAYGLLKSAIRDPNPVLYFEHKFLYRRIKEELPQASRTAAAGAARAARPAAAAAGAEGEAATAGGDGDGLVPLGKARLARPGRDLSVISYGAMLHVALEAAERLAAEGIDLEVLDLRTIKPLDEEAILATVRKTNRVLVLTEEQLSGSVAGEVAARIVERGFAWLDGPVHRLCCPDTPVPYSPTLEEAYLPNVDKLAARVRELASY
jgi:2-oxoisovalerate dehydrogenase E1 component beta subunit